jgi:hypothetical protein
MLSTAQYWCLAAAWQRWATATALVRAEPVRGIDFERIPHPPYSRYFHIVGPLKEAFGWKAFQSDEEMQEAVHEWLPMQKRIFMRIPGTSEALEDMHWTQQRISRKVTRLYRTYLLWVSGTITNVSIWLTHIDICSEFKIFNVTEIMKNKRKTGRRVF